MAAILFIRATIRTKRVEYFMKCKMNVWIYLIVDLASERLSHISPLSRRSMELEISTYSTIRLRNEMIRTKWSGRTTNEISFLRHSVSSKIYKAVSLRIVSRKVGTRKKRIINSRGLKMSNFLSQLNTRLQWVSINIAIRMLNYKLTTAVFSRNRKICVLGTWRNIIKLRSRSASMIMKLSSNTATNLI